MSGATNRTRPSSRRSFRGRAASDGGAGRAEFVLRPWPERRARRARRVLVALVVLAPVVATAATWWAVSVDSTNVVLEPVDRQGTSVLTVGATALNLDLARREMTFRLVFQPTGDIVDADDNELTEDVTLILNDISGNASQTFPSGAPMSATTIVVPLRGSQLLYPFDHYEALLVIGATAGPPNDKQPLPLDLAMTASLDDFGVTATARHQLNSFEAQVELGRRGAVVFWVVLFMALVWAIALGCAAMAWFTVVYAKEPPVWLYAFFAAILFALPTLRIGLPGGPPYGALVDWAAFYWGVSLVAVSLVALLTLWNVEARARLRAVVRSDAVRARSENAPGTESDLGPRGDGRSPSGPADTPHDG